MKDPARNHRPVPGRGRIFFLFLDGVGIGKRDGRVNPFFSMPLPGFEALFGGPMISLGRPTRTGPRSTVRPIDATLGVEGLPQSGTGQTAILTGVNAARALGRHFGPYPHTELRPLLAERNIFGRLAGAGLSPEYINAFPAQYTEHLRKHPGRTGAISLAWRSNGFGLNGAGDLLAGTALSSDCTSEGWGRLGYAGIPVIGPEDAALVALKSLGKHDFVVFEYYLTDHAGHGRSLREASSILTTLDRFIGRLVREMNPSRDTLIMASDHGNFEDLSTKQHTLNPVPFACAGAGHERLARSVGDLTGIAPAILEYFS